MCCNKPQSWGAFMNGGTLSPFAVNPYPSPPAPVTGRTDAIVDMRDSGAEAYFSTVPQTFSLLLQQQGRVGISAAGIPANVAQFPLDSLDSLVGQRKQEWKLAPALG